MAAAHGLSAALEAWEGSVTEFLESLVGEAVAARFEQRTTTGGVDRSLHLGPGEPLTFRTAMLRGRRSGRAFVYAESTIATARLAREVVHRLWTTSDPIGRVLSEHGLVVHRAALGSPPPPPSWAGAGRWGRPDDSLHARHYRLDVGTVAVMTISEWFLPELATFLPGA